MMTLVAVMCHAFVGITSPVCHEEIVTRMEITNPLLCIIRSQEIVADWKSKTKFNGDQWTVESIHCNPGDYQTKDAI